MKRIISLAIVMVAAGMLFAQPAPVSSPPQGFENVKQLVDKEVLDIQIKAFIPDITTFKDKAVTYNKEGNFNLPKNILELIQKVSKEQLTNWQKIRNKWLEESK